MDAALVKGRNARAWDVDGKEYIDFTAGIGVNALGYCDPEWSAAVAGQAGKIQHMCNYYYCPENTALAQELSQASGMAKAFFCNSGAEANECAVKIARKYGEKRGAYRIVTLENSFHGRTLTTLAATGQEGFHREFLPLTEGFLYAQAGDLAGIQAAAGRLCLRVMLEMVQGEGGVIPMDEGFVKGLAQLCREKDVLLLIDEVQTGIGRTGRFFAYQGYASSRMWSPAPRALPGAFPWAPALSAKGWGTSCSPARTAPPLGATPLPAPPPGWWCAGCRSRISSKAWRRRRLLPGKAGGHAPGGVRPGPWLMLGVKLKEKDAHDVLVQCAKAGLLILTAKELVRFLPPLTITQEDIDQGLAIFQQVLAQ